MHDGSTYRYITWPSLSFQGQKMIANLLTGDPFLKTRFHGQINESFVEEYTARKRLKKCVQGKEMGFSLEYAGE